MAALSQIISIKTAMIVTLSQIISIKTAIIAALSQVISLQHYHSSFLLKLQFLKYIITGNFYYNGNFCSIIKVPLQFLQHYQI